MLFACLISFFTLGLSAASDAGAVLYPLKYWMLKRSSKTKARLDAIRSYQNYRRKNKRWPSYWIDPAIEKIEWQLFWKNLWHKPILTCPKCMPSFWGIVLFFSLPFTWNWWVLLVGIPCASAIVVIIIKLCKGWGTGP